MAQNLTVICSKCEKTIEPDLKRMDAAWHCPYCKQYHPDLIYDFRSIGFFFLLSVIILMFCILFLSFNIKKYAPLFLYFYLNGILLTAIAREARVSVTPWLNRYLNILLGTALGVSLLFGYILPELSDKNPTSDIIFISGVCLWGLILLSLIILIKIYRTRKLAQTMIKAAPASASFQSEFRIQHKKCNASFIPDVKSNSLWNCPNCKGNIANLTAHSRILANLSLGGCLINLAVTIAYAVNSLKFQPVILLPLAATVLFGTVAAGLTYNKIAWRSFLPSVLFMLATALSFVLLIWVPYQDIKVSAAASPALRSAVLNPLIAGAVLFAVQFLYPLWIFFKTGALVDNRSSIAA